MSEFYVVISYQSRICPDPPAILKSFSTIKEAYAFIRMKKKTIHRRYIPTYFRVKKVKVPEHESVS